VSEHSWHPIDLAAVESRPATQPDTGRLIYPGGRHTLTGEPEAGKGLFAMALAVAEIRAGRTIAWIDLESDEDFIAERVRCFGLDGDELQRFAYFHPTHPIGTTGALEAISEFLVERNPAIAVLDAFAGLADLHNLDSWKTDGVERTYRLVIEPWRQQGAATIVIDHVVKSGPTEAASRPAANASWALSTSTSAWKSSTSSAEDAPDAPRSSSTRTDSDSFRGHTWETSYSPATRTGRSPAATSNRRRQRTPGSRPR
jgi:KaiC/GvpD/RAD55 family RecA-like ATPase